MSIGVSSIFGFFLILSLLFSIQDFDATVSSEIGQPVTQILFDIFGVNGAIVLMTLIMLCVWHCGLFSMTSNSRMMFAFSRDGALPRFFHQVDARFQSPIRTGRLEFERFSNLGREERKLTIGATVWLAAFLSFLLALPSLGSTVAFSAATSIATIGLYLSYGIPILIALINPDGYTKGPFSLGIMSRPVGFVAVAWILFITVIFCLPTANPVNDQTLNYTVVAVGIITIFAIGGWLLSARKWFTGPIRQIEVRHGDTVMTEPVFVGQEKI